MNNPAPSSPLTGTSSTNDLSSNDAASHAPSMEQQANEQLTTALQMLRDRVGSRLRTLLETLETELFAPLQTAVHEAAGIHEALVKTSHFDQPVDAIAADLRWKRVRDYRHDTMARVIDPLRQELAKADVGATLHDRWRAFWDDLAGLPAHLPVSITRAEPSALYAPAPDDPVIVALRKRWVQLRRHLASYRSATQDVPPSQTIPVRHLAAYHLRMRLPRRLAPHEASFFQEFARPVAAFEHAVTTWTHHLLDAERHLNRPLDYVPDAPETTDADTSFSALPANSLSPEEAWEIVRAASEALNEQLHTLASFSFDACAQDAKHAVHSGWAALDKDITSADSFLLDLNDRTLSPEAPADQQDAIRPPMHWPAWYQRVANRLAFCSTLSALRDATTHHCETLLSTLLETSLYPLLTLHDEAAQQLHALHDEADALFSSPPPDGLTGPLRTIYDEAVQAITSDFLEPLRAARFRSRLSEILNQVPVPTDSFFDDHPATFELHAPALPDAERIDPETSTRVVDLRTLVQNHFDAFFADALRDALHPFQQRIEATLAEADEPLNILKFNLGEALDELEAAANSDDASAAAARELTLNGLARSAETTTAHAQQVREAVLPLLARPATAAYTQAWTDLHDRVRVESRMREHLLDLRSRVSRETQEATEQAERGLRTLRVRFRRALRLGRGRAEELVQMGRSAVGATAFDEDSFLETLEALLRLDQTLATLPLVYRRLFALQPVTDPSLLVGRQNDLTRIQRHVEQWQNGLTNALVITGHHGSGLTSLLNVVQRTRLDHTPVHTLSLDERIRSESAFAARVVDTLQLSLSSSDAPLTLERVREHLQNRPPPSSPPVCLVEHLDHLFLRTVHGSDLINRTLTFMSRTDAQVLWIATLSEHAWQVLDRTASPASGLVLHHRLTPIERPELETLILTRHQRSGLPLHFDAPDEPNPLLRQRLRKADSEENRQSLLQNEYFDRLYTHCGSNIMLALLYWIRSVQRDDEKPVMRVPPIQPLNFGFLERFSMQQAFALKAFLDHGTLTIEEYSEVAHLSPTTCLELFESLTNTMLLQPAEMQGPEAASTLAPIEPERRYRIRPLVIHPVTQYLRGKNILYG